MSTSTYGDGLVNGSATVTRFGAALAMDVTNVFGNWWNCSVNLVLVRRRERDKPMGVMTKQCREQSHTNNVVGC